MFRRSNKSNHTRRSRSGVASRAATALASRGVVTIAICTGAVMWGYALINLATRASANPSIERVSIKTVSASLSGRRRFTFGLTSS